MKALQTVRGGRWLRLLVFVIVLFYTRILKAQNDSSRYAAYPNKVTGRFYLSNKYTTIQFKNDQYKLRYQPNTSINLGVGATYKWATLNIGIGFLNRNPGKGRTHYLDLQFHNYGRKFVLDILGEFYHGFYLFPAGSGTTDKSFYKRPDLHVDEGGVNFQYVFNHKRFSYRAAFLQNEWQKESAGSFLAGLETYYGKMSADSSFVPSKINQQGATENLHQLRFFEIGPNAGYAYTLVIKQHYFLTGSGALSFDYNTSSMDNHDGKSMTSGFILNKTLKFCGGYNSARYALSFLYLNNGVQATSHSAPHQLILNTGNFRLIFVHRFYPNRKERKILKVLP